MNKAFGVHVLTCYNYEFAYKISLIFFEHFKGAHLQMFDTFWQVKESFQEQSAVYSHLCWPIFGSF